MLPDGIFSNKKSKFGEILEGLAVEDVGIFRAIFSILRASGIFGTFCGHMVHGVVIWYILSRFGMLCRKHLAALSVCFIKEMPGAGFRPQGKGNEKIFWRERKFWGPRKPIQVPHKGIKSNLKYFRRVGQGCQMVFKNKKNDLGKFWGALE
jgi:hypothetical protein